LINLSSFLVSVIIQYDFDKDPDQAK
jgi:hypothetical protein